MRTIFMILSINDDCFSLASGQKTLRFLKAEAGFCLFCLGLFSTVFLGFPNSVMLVCQAKFVRQKEPQTRKTALSRLLAFSKLWRDCPVTEAFFALISPIVTIFGEAAFFYVCYSTQLSYMACTKEGFEPSTHSVKVKLERFRQHTVRYVGGTMWRWTPASGSLSLTWRYKGLYLLRSLFAQLKLFSEIFKKTGLSHARQPQRPHTVQDHWCLFT